MPARASRAATHIIIVFDVLFPHEREARAGGGARGVHARVPPEGQTGRRLRADAARVHRIGSTPQAARRLEPLQPLLRPQLHLPIRAALHEVILLMSMMLLEINNLFSESTPLTGITVFGFSVQ